MIPVEEALPEEIEAMCRADEEYARGECVLLDGAPVIAHINLCVKVQWSQHFGNPRTTANCSFS
jgi:hypothetical protein